MDEQPPSLVPPKQGRPGFGRAWRLLLILTGSFSVAEAAPEMAVFPPAEIARLVAAVPSYTRFGYTGVTFFDGKLFAASNIGLLEVEGSAPTRLYRLNQRYSVVEGCWMDRANRRLWVLVEGRLANTDGKPWRIMRLPKPKEGHLTRGDSLMGYRGYSNARRFWIEGAGCAWTLEPEHFRWIEEPKPLTYGESPKFPPRCAGLIPLENGPLFVMRHVFSTFISPSVPDNPRDLGRYRNLDGDTVHYRLESGEWREVPGDGENNFIIQEIVSVGERAFVRTHLGEVWEVRRSGISKLDIPERCLGMVLRSDGTLLAFFRRVGLYEWRKNVWAFLLPSPFPPEQNHWIRLAEDRGQIALAASPIPNLVNGRSTYDSSAGLWLSEGSGWKPVSFSTETKP